MTQDPLRSTRDSEALSRRPMYTLMKYAPRLSFAAKAQVAVVAFGLLRAFFELGLPLSGGDPLRKWMWARLIYHGWSPSRAIWGGWDHHASRLALNVPALLSQYLLGDAPWVYYVAPLCLSSLALILLFRLALRLGSVAFAFWTCLSYAWFLPIRDTTQLMPDGLSTPYVLATTLCLVKLVEAEAMRRRVFWTLAAGVCMMIAEQAKEPNLFFVPGLTLGVWLCARSRPLALLFGASVSVLLLVELWVYRALFTEYPLGRFSVIADKHLSNKTISQELASAWELITRLEETFRGFWGLQLALFLAVAVFCLLRFRRLRPALQLVLLASLGFLLLHAFGVRSIRPLRTWQAAGQRYVVVCYPFTWLTLCWLVAQLIALLPMRIKRLPLASPQLAWASTAALLLYSWAIRFPGLEAHPLTQLGRLDREGKAAYAEGIPIVSRDPKKYSTQSFQALFWDGFDQPHFAKRRKLYPLRGVPWRGGLIWWLVDPARDDVNLDNAKQVFRKWRSEKREVLLVRHAKPFEMKRLGFDEL